MHTFAPLRFGLPDGPVAEVELADAAATRALGAALAAALAGGGFVGLVGDLGAGKTTLVQGLVAELDPHAEASSPSYTLLNEYEVGPGVFHFDLYRLQTADELETVGYWDVAEDRRAIVIVEWIDRFPEAWARRGVVLELQHHAGRRLARLWVAGDASPWTAVLEDLA